MPIQITGADQEHLMALIDGILEAVVTAEVTPQQAREAIAKIVMMAVQDYERDVRDWLAGEWFEDWKLACRSGQALSRRRPAPSP